MVSLVIQYKLQPHNNLHAFDLRVKIEDEMNDCLGKAGLGHCDGGDLGKDEMNIFCFVVDADQAKLSIVNRLQKLNQLEGAVIATRITSGYKVLWPENFGEPFNIS